MAVPGEEAVALDPLKVEMDEDDLESRAKDAEVSIGDDFAVHLATVS